ncbi:MAG: hypothetical protein ACKOX6_11315 [Bdellovibrio sp.]
MKKLSEPKGPAGEYKKANGVSDELYQEIMAEIGPGVWDPRIHTKKKSVYDETDTGIEVGFLVKECNKASDFNWADVDFDHYIQEVRKILI